MIIFLSESVSYIKSASYVQGSAHSALLSCAAYSLDIGGPSGNGTANPDSALALLYSLT